MKSLSKLYIITPFKGNDIASLESTMESIKNSFIEIKIIHIVVYFQTDLSNISLVEINNNSNKSSYNLRTMEIKNPGIYTAINCALDTIKKNNFYLVLGSGDIIESINNKKISIIQENIILLNYELSSHKKINLIRDKYSGMPYCHNAIIFKNSNLRYSNNYSISSDYEYFLNYLNKYQIKFKNFSKYINYDFKLIFESKIGLSSNSRIKKNYENLIICIKFFGLKGIINFIKNKINYFLINVN